MNTQKRIVALPLSGHPTQNKIYILQIVETGTEVLLVHKEITNGEFELLNDRGHLKQYYPVDYSSLPKGISIPIVEHYEIL